MKILHAPVNIANQGWLLSRGQRALGHEADLHAVDTAAFGFPADLTLNLQEGTRPERVSKIFRYVAECVATDYDVYHFYYHASLMPRSYGIAPYADLPILRGMGRRVFFHLVGCDFRIPALSYARNPHSMCVPCRSCLDRDKVGMLETIASHASGLIAGGEHSRLFVGDFGLNMLPVAVDLSALEPGEPQRESPLIVHAPTNRAVKGTDSILEAVKRLKADGMRFDFELIEGVSHDVAIHRVRQADILVDQLGSDFYATAAVEAMAMGRVVVGGMLEEAAAQYGERSPVVPANRDTLFDVLRGLIGDVERRAGIAEAGPAYAATHHDHLKLAERSLAIYTRPVPPVGEGETASAIASRLRAQVRAATPAYKATATPDAADIPPAERAASAGEPRFPFPVEPLPNPRLALPLHHRFGQGLEEYVDDKYRLGRAFFRNRLDELGLTIDGPVLDMGSGPGHWAITIAEANPDVRVVACDRNDFLHACCVEKRDEMALDNLEPVQADIRELPFDDGEFATVLCIGVLQLVNVSGAFPELVRVTRPGGRILINVPGPGFYLRNMTGALVGRRPDIFKQNLKFVRNTLKKTDGAFTYFTPRRLRSLADEHGLRLEWVRPTGLYPPQKPRFMGLTVNMDVLFTVPDAGAGTGASA
ncbi:MAG TPA: methyltransferase domain-containing protein [Phycisphaerales bacterium]|nr:methyltransferase domain-containing protein [Phycisphaerales bacterium]